MLELQSKLRRRYIDLDQPVCDTKFVSFDLETTGFAPRGGDEIISIGAVMLNGSRLVSNRYFHKLVDPKRPIPHVVTELTGITNEMVDNEADFLSVFCEFLDFAEGSVLLGHGVDFDVDFINYKLRKFSLGRLHNPVLDTRQLYQTVYPDLGRYSLDYLLQFNGILPVSRHTALGDAMLTAQIFRGIFSTLSTLGCFTLRNLCRLAEVTTVGR